jgi:hypothetical protein
MKKAIVVVTLFFLLSIPAMAADDDDFGGRLGVNAGMYFFNNPGIDDSSWFGGVEFTGDMWSIALDYTTPGAIGGGDDQLMLLHLDYLWYFNMDDYESTDIPTYVGVGYTHRFQGDVVEDGGGFNILLGMDWDENWNFEAKYLNFGSDDSMWGIGVGWFFN